MQKREKRIVEMMVIKRQAVVGVMHSGGVGLRRKTNSSLVTKRSYIT